VISSEKIGFEEVARSIEVTESPGLDVPQLQGAKLLCGKPRCPIIVKAQSIGRSNYSYSDKISGSSPPGVFVGRIGYPKVSIGPMVPPQYGDTSIMDTPEFLAGRPLETIVDYRYSLVRGTRGRAWRTRRTPAGLCSQLQSSRWRQARGPDKALKAPGDAHAQRGHATFRAVGPMEKFRTSNSRWRGGSRSRTTTAPEGLGAISPHTGTASW